MSQANLACHTPPSDPFLSAWENGCLENFTVWWPNSAFKIAFLPAHFWLLPPGSRQQFLFCLGTGKKSCPGQKRTSRDSGGGSSDFLKTFFTHVLNPDLSFPSLHHSHFLLPPNSPLPQIHTSVSLQKSAGFPKILTENNIATYNKTRLIPS